MLDAMFPRHRATEERLLADAERYIAEAEQRITRQRQLIEHLAAMGHDTTLAERLLGEIEMYVETAREHRWAILRRLEERRAGSIQS